MELIRGKKQNYTTLGVLDYENKQQKHDKRSNKIRMSERVLNFGTQKMVRASPIKR